MKRQFESYYKRRTAEELKELFKASEICLDTNVLLNLHGYEQGTADQWIKVLKSVAQRLWMPHQVAVEYHHNVHKLIRERINAAEEQSKFGESFQGPNSTEKQNKLQEKLRELTFIDEPCANSLLEAQKELYKNFEEAFAKSNATVAKAFEEWRKRYIDRSSKFLDEIATIFDGKVGEPYDPDQLTKIVEISKARFIQRIPPGFADKKKLYKHGNPYGDAIMWFQLIDRAKQNKKPVVLVTADRAKEDWFYEDYSGKTLSARAELRYEMQRLAGVDFQIYKPDNFLKAYEVEVGEKLPADTLSETERKQGDTPQAFRAYQAVLIDLLPPGGLALGPNEEVTFQINVEELLKKVREGGGPPIVISNPDIVKQQKNRADNDEKPKTDPSAEKSSQEHAEEKAPKEDSDDDSDSSTK